MRTRTFAIGLLVLVILVILAIVFVPRMLKPEIAQVPAATYWPTQGWLISAPEEQGFDSAKLAEELQALQKRDTKINSLLIVRNGYVVLDAYFLPLRSFISS